METPAWFAWILYAASTVPSEHTAQSSSHCEHFFCVNVCLSTCLSLLSFSISLSLSPYLYLFSESVDWEGSTVWICGLARPRDGVPPASHVVTGALVHVSLVASRPEAVRNTHHSRHTAERREGQKSRENQRISMRTNLEVLNSFAFIITTSTSDSTSDSECVSVRLKARCPNVERESENQHETICRILRGNV